jgi:PAS domain S-box-containing protein
MTVSEERSADTESRQHAITAIGFGAAVLIVLNVVLFIRNELLGSQSNFLTSTPGWVFSAIFSVLVLALLAAAVWLTQRHEQQLGDVNSTLLSLERVTEAALERLTMDELLDTLADSVKDVVRGNEASIYLLNRDDRGLTRRSVSDGASAETLRALSSQPNATVTVTPPEGRFGASTSASRSPTGPSAPTAAAATPATDLNRQDAIRMGAGLIGAAAERGETIVVNSATCREREGTPTPPFLHPSEMQRAAVACPLMVEGAVMGVVEVLFDGDECITDEQVKLLRTVADRAAAAIEAARLYDAERRSRLAAEHARGHLAFIAEASQLFDSAFDNYEAVLGELVDVVVPSFADWCLIELADAEGRLQRLAVKHAKTEVGERLDDVIAKHRGWAGPVRQVVASGGSVLRYGLDLPDERVTDFVAVMRALEVESTIALPIRVRGLSLGAIILGRTRSRRGFRPSDQAAAEDVARRAAVAIERVLLYLETREAADYASRHANQLRRLMQAAPEITAPLSRVAVLRVLADQVRRVLGTERAIATIPAEPLRVSSPPAPEDALGGLDVVRYVESLLTSRPSDSDVRMGPGRYRPGLPSAHAGMLPNPGDAGSWLSVPIPSTSMGVIGAIIVTGKQQGRFTDEDEAILVSMAQLASAALENARLYQAMKTDEERLRALVEAAPLGIVELDLRGDVRRWNSASHVMFDWPDPERGTEDNATPTFPPSVEARIRLLAKRAEMGELSQNVDVTLEESSNGRRELAVATAPLRDGLGDVNGVLAVFADVTEQKDLELRLFTSQRLEAIGRLAGGVAHDFNNLLTVILGYSELLLRRMKATDKARPDLEAIRSAGEQAAKLTSQLLAIGRQQVSETAVVSVQDTVAAIVEVLRRLVAEDVVVNVDVDPGWVLIDSGQLEQVLLNLVVNASDAMVDGGRLSIISREETLETPVPAGLGMVPPGRWVVITVEDTGMGMEPEVLDHCFEPFFSTKDRTKGTGLGLATVYGIIDQHKGYIQIRSAPGAGTTAKVFLPAVHEDVDGEEGGEPADWLPPGSEYVLLVEDGDAVRSLAAQVLTSQGYIVLEASNGAEALEVAAAHDESIDLLITDVVMPGMDGVELSRRLTKERPDLPVLFISGYTGAAKEKLRAVSDSANFLGKPFKPDQLVRRVRELLDSSVQVDQGSKR